MQLSLAHGDYVAKWKNAYTHAHERDRKKTLEYSPKNWKLLNKALVSDWTIAIFHIQTLGGQCWLRLSIFARDTPPDDVTDKNTLRIRKENGNFVGVCLWLLHAVLSGRSSPFSWFSVKETLVTAADMTMI